MRIVTKEKCKVCGENVEFCIDESATLLREATCSNCGASIRTSDIAGVIDKFVKESGRNKLRILNLSSQGKIHELYSNLKGYTCGEYFDGVPSGDFKDGIMCVDLQNMPFDDDSIDLIISEDVLEHVYDINKALNEINRVLKIGGKHIFTVPVHENSVTMTRKNNALEVIHGDPLRMDGIKVITDFGRDIVTFVDRFGMKTTINKLHVFHKPEETSFIDDEADFYMANKHNMMSVFRYNSIVMVSEKTKAIEERTFLEQKHNYRKDSLEFTGERFVPGILGREINSEHYQRYYAVKSIVAGKKVLDAACGAGYGSAIMAEAAEDVTGIDISSEAVKNAQNKYKDINNLHYIEASVTNLPFPDNAFDVVVSFETIEHVNADMQINFIKEIRRVLKDDGILVMSSPDKRTYSDIPGFDNEYHVHELYFHEFENLLHGYFKHVSFYVQGEHDLSAEIIRPLNHKINTLKVINDFIIDKDKDLYFIAVCDNSSNSINVDDLSSAYAFKYVPCAFSFVDNEYKGDNIILPEFYEQGEICKVRFNLIGINSVGRLRFDPLEDECCEVEFQSIKTDVKDYSVLPFNAAEKCGSKYKFLTVDPVFEIIGDYTNATYMEIEYKLKILKNREVSVLSSKILKGEREEKQRLKENYNDLQYNYDKLKEQIKDIKSTRGYRLLEKMRWLRK